MRVAAILLLILAGCSKEPAVAPTLTLGDVSASVRSNLAAYTNGTLRGHAQVQAAKARFDIAYRLALEANMGDARFPARGDVVKAAEEIGYLTRQP